MRADSGYIYILNEHPNIPNYKIPYSGATVYWNVSNTGNVTFSIAICNRTDKFDKKIGREIAYKYYHEFKDRRINLHRNIFDFMGIEPQQLEHVNFNDFIKLFREYVTKFYNRKYKRTQFLYKSKIVDSDAGQIAVPVLSQKEWKDVESLSDMMKAMGLVCLRTTNKRSKVKYHLLCTLDFE